MLFLWGTSNNDKHATWSTCQTLQMNLVQYCEKRVQGFKFMNRIYIYLTMIHGVASMPFHCDNAIQAEEALHRLEAKHSDSKQRSLFCWISVKRCFFWRYSTYRLLARPSLERHSLTPGLGLTVAKQAASRKGPELGFWVCWCHLAMFGSMWCLEKRTC